MKKGIILSFSLLVIIIYINGCGINGQSNDKKIESQSIAEFNTEAREQQIEKSNPEAFSNIFQQADDGHRTEQISLQLLELSLVREARIISHEDKLLIAVDSEADDTHILKEEIRDMVRQYYPNKQVIVVTNRQQVDRLRLLDDGIYRKKGESYGINLRRIFNEANEGVEEPFK